VVLFAREPAREARAKGFAAPEAAELFADFAVGWRDAARRAGARLVVSTPPEDRAAWRLSLPGSPDVLWIAQRGRSLGERLEAAARSVAELAGCAVIVGGDVVPSLTALETAFAALEDGAEAALAPAPDGGVSVVGLSPRHLDLLRGIEPRRRDVFASLTRRLARRDARVATVCPASDVDGRRSARRLLRRVARRGPLALLLKLLLCPPRLSGSSTSHAARLRPFCFAPALRGPPLPA
jgi:Uncharacterized protein conserved in bacteria (DUF2064)